MLAAAVMKLWPDAKLTIGPATADGFYYDVDFGEAKVSADDFKKIEKEMSGLIGKTTEETIKNAKDYIQNKAVENSIREIKEENLGKREQQ